MLRSGGPVFSEMLHRTLSAIRPFLAVAAMGALLFATSAWGQTSPCDLNNDGSTNLVDTQLAVNMALGISPCTATVYGTSCNIIVVQRVINAALGGGCVTGTTAHSVSLNWTASTSSSVTGYNVYRGTTSGGTYTKLNSTPVSGTSYTDTAVQAGQTYYYVCTAVDSSSNESVYSSQAQGTVPTP